MKLTKQIVSDYANRMARHFGARLIDKRTAPEMIVADFFLEQLGIPDSSRWLSNYSMTIGGRIYIPYTPGVERAGWSLEAQVENIAHECQHVQQYTDEGRKFLVRYLSSRSKRAGYEADAMYANLEIYYAINGYPKRTTSMVNSLRNYVLRPADIRVVRKKVNNHNRFVALRYVSTEAGKAGIKILRELSR